MGGGGKSSSSTSNTNTSGQNAIQGDNLGTAISGVNGSTINVQSTDHGAIEKAAQLGELAMTTLGNATENVVDKNAEVAKSAMSTTADVSNNAMKNVTAFADTAINKYSSSNSENLQMMAGLAGSQATQNAKNLETVAALAQAKADGGQVATSEQMTKTVMYLAAAAVGAFAIMRLG
jgi:hypothetical protein